MLASLSLSKKTEVTVNRNPKQNRHKVLAKLQNAIREKADELFRLKMYREARVAYLEAAEQIEAMACDDEHRVCLMYSGVAASSWLLGQKIRAIKEFRQAAAYLDDDMDFFVPSFAYICDHLYVMDYYVKSRAQRAELNALKSELFKRFKNSSSKFKSAAPQAKPRTLKVQGKVFRDDYLELENAESSYTKTWLQKQQEYSSFTSSLALLNFSTPTDYYRASGAQLNMLPYQFGEFFYFEGYSEADTRKFISRSSSATGKRQLLISEADLCQEGYALESSRVSKDGKYIAYGLSHNGSDWLEWQIRNLKTGKNISNFKLHVYGSRLFFHPDGKGIVYYREEKPASLREAAKGNPKIYYRPLHARGQKERLIHKAINKKSDHLGVVFISDGKMLLIAESMRGESKSFLYLRSLETKPARSIKLFAGKPKEYDFLGQIQQRLFFFLQEEAQAKRKLIAIDIHEDRLAVKSETEIKLTGLASLERDYEIQVRDLILSKGQLIANCLCNRGAFSRLVRLDHNGNFLGEIDLPFKGIIENINLEFESSHIFFELGNFSQPSTICHHNLRTKKTSILFPPTVSPCRDLISRVVEVKSTDGTLVPMWIIHRKNVKPGPQTPTLMYVYGGFNLMLLPAYSSKILSWTALGGVWAQPYLRGGGELGPLWHNAAIKKRKQTTFDDTIACAKHIIRNKISSARKLAVFGISNGGLTVGAVLNQHPELFGAAISSNGLFDMLKFSSHSFGRAWESEYGSVKNRSELNHIMSYSPYHNIKRGRQLPAVLLCASEHDDRVPPWHSYKFAAALNKIAPPNTPVILRLEANSGHTSHRFTYETRDQLAFLKWALDF